MNKRLKIERIFDTKMEDLVSIHEFEKNSIDIESYIDNASIDDFDTFVLIKITNYLRPLRITGKYKKAQKVNIAIETSINKHKNKSKYLKEFAEMLTFEKSICLSKLGRYEESNEFFKQLIIKAPDNELFGQWYHSNNRDQIDKFFKPIIYIDAGIYVFLMSLHLAGIYSETSFLQDLFFFGGVLIFVVSYLLKKWSDKKPLPQK